MHHDTALLATIAIGLALAFLLGFAAARLRLPPLVGYLVAGVVVGPFTPGFVADAALASQLAELGVILLMFGVGLHFSLRDLLAVRKIAVPGAIAQIGAATALGIGVSRLWGWSFGAGLVFGLALSVASTVVLLRALDELGVLESVNGRIAIGWLIVEDLAMVLALVLLPALAESLGGTAAADGRPGLLATLAITLGKVALFLALMLFVGARVVPWMLEQVARVGTRELFTLSVLALALGIAFGSAVLFGVSFALGAFFAGVVINGSDVSHAAAAEALPLQDAFAVLFFVSVGMLFDPSVLVRAPLHVLAVLAIILLGKSVAACAIVLLFRYPIGTALTVSASLAQIGEFSFILAGLGMSLGLLPREGQSLILAGALISITVNPLMFRATAAIERWIRNHPRLVSALERPSPVPVSLPGDGNALRGHAIIVGFGRVGSTIGKALDKHSLPYLVIEQDRLVVEKLRARGVHAVFGDAARPGILEHAHTEHARVLIVTAPEPIHARRVVTLARRLNPEVDTVVRTHTSADQAYLERLGVGLAVMGERELALGMTRYALRGLGVAADDAEMSVQAMRLVPAAAHATPPRPEPVG
jgi:CPA2 family monovalent cation:H+ antiporter-2